MNIKGESLFVPYVSASKPVETHPKSTDFTIGPEIPEYLAVDNKDPIRQWKIKHEQEMFDKLIRSQKNLREKQHSFKLEIVKLLRKVPIDLITKEFLNKEKLTIDARAYIIDKIIPVVVLGLEKLLIEADKNGLIEKEFDPNFNPINFLAQYLMRNNPQFSNFNEASPYVRGVRQVVEELKIEIFHLSDNKLARIKTSAKTKRIEREKEEERKKLEAKRRIEIYQKLFDQFLIQNETKVDYETVHLSIKSFSEIVNKFPEEMKNKLVPILNMVHTEIKHRKLGRKDFGLLISHYADDMPLDIFDHFADHLSKCAKLYRSAMEKETRRKLLSNLFVICDLEEVGLINRQRVIMLFDQFFSKVPENIKAMLRDPKHWPISDYNERKRNQDKKVNVNNSSKIITGGSLNSNQNVSNKLEYEEEMDNQQNINHSEIQIIDASTEELHGEIEDLINEEVNKNIQKESVVTSAPQNLEEVTDEFHSDAQAENNVIKEMDDNFEVSDINDLITQIIDETKKEESLEDPSKSPSEKQILELSVDEISNDSKIENNLREQVDVQLEDESGNISNKQMIESNVEEYGDDTENVDESDEESSETIIEKSKEKDQSEDDMSELHDPVVDSGVAKEKFLSEIFDSTISSEEQVKIVSVKKDLGIEKKPERHASIIEALQENESELPDAKSNSDHEDLEEEYVENKIEREPSKVSNATHSTAYDEENINFPQFFQVTEEFLGDIHGLDVLEDLIEFIREGYQETPEERLKRLQKARRIVVSAQRRQLMGELFDNWDKDNSGSVSMNEISEVLMKYKNGILKAGIKAAKTEAKLSRPRRTKDIRLNQKDFRTFFYTIARENKMLDKEGETEMVINYFIGLVQRTYAEKMRGEARRKWLNSILWASEVSCGSMDGVYRATFQAMYKDSEHHGDGKIVSASIGLLEDNEVDVEVKGKYLLHFMASTADQVEFVVGQRLDGSSKNIYFQSIYCGNVIHLPHTIQNPNVIYFNSNITTAAKEGAMVIVPIKDDLARVLGITIVDTLNDPFPSKTVFSNHEILFYQGINQHFCTAFYQVEVLRRLVTVSESAISWICRAIESIKSADLYLREKRDQKATEAFVLRFVLSANDQGGVSHHSKIARLEKSDNLFKTYLFDTVETSQTTNNDAYGERHIAIPVRDLNGMALVVIDINIGKLKYLPDHENAEIIKMMGLLQQAFLEILKVSQVDDSLLENADNYDDFNQSEPRTRLISVTGTSNAETLFDQLMLADLRSSISNLDLEAYAELRSYPDPPITIHVIIQALLTLLYPKESQTGLFKNWEKCKKYITLSLGKVILSFDPFGDISHIPMNLIYEAMEKIPRSEVAKHSSKPSLVIYNWLSCCILLIQHRHPTNP